jgi:hypothetical protein
LEKTIGFLLGICHADSVKVILQLFSFGKEEDLRYPYVYYLRQLPHMKEYKILGGSKILSYLAVMEMWL